MCNTEKALGEFYAYGYTTGDGKRGTRYESRCRPCAQARRRATIAANPELAAKQVARWRNANRAHVAMYAKRRQALPEVKAQKAKFQRMRKARLRASAGDDEAIRAVYDEAFRIQALVANCPVFDLPELGHEMHVDHVMPLARGGKHEASNLQILPKGINLRKGAKCPR